MKIETQLITASEVSDTECENCGSELDYDTWEKKGVRAGQRGGSAAWSCPNCENIITVLF